MIGVKVLSSWNNEVLKQMFVSLCRDRGIENKHRVWVQNAAAHLNVCVRRTGRNRQEERVLSSHSLTQESIRLLSQYIGDIFTLVAVWSLARALECAVEVVVGKRIE
jgi:hypothetical protein